MMTKFNQKIILVVLLIIALIACDDSNPVTHADVLKAANNHLPITQTHFNCDDAPETAIVDQAVAASLKDFLSVSCKKGLGHIISAPKDFMWVYKEINHAGVSLPIVASINAKINANINGDNFHDYYFTDISAEKLDYSATHALLTLLREKNHKKPIVDRDRVIKITAINNHGAKQKVYLLAQLSVADDDRELPPELGFVCNPDCEYSNLFYKRIWLNAAELAAKMRAQQEK